MLHSPLIEIGLPISLFLIMIGIGLSLSVADFAREVKKPRGFLLGTFCQIALLPGLAFVVAWAMNLPPAIAIGLVIVGACPGGATSNVIAYLAKGNVALSIILTVTASLITILSLPLFVSMAIHWQLGESTTVQMPVIQTVILLTGILVLPVCIGMTIRTKYPAVAQKLERPLNLFGAFVLLVMVCLISWAVRDRIVDLAIQGGFVSAVFGVGALAVAWLMGGAFKLALADRLTLGVELCIKNTTIGMMVATTFLGSAEMAIPSMVYGLSMYSFGALMVATGRKLSLVPG